MNLCLCYRYPGNSFLKLERKDRPVLALVPKIEEGIFGGHLCKVLIFNKKFDNKLKEGYFRGEFSATLLLMNVASGFQLFIYLSHIVLNQDIELCELQAVDHSNYQITL